MLSHPVFAVCRLDITPLGGNQQPMLPQVGEQPVPAQFDAPRVQARLEQEVQLSGA